MVSLATMTSSLVQRLSRSAAAAGFATQCLPWHSSHTRRTGNQLYWSLIKQFTSGGELIHGTSEWHMVRPATSSEISYEAYHRNYSRQAVLHGVFNSRNAVSEEIWRKALRHATNKLEVLRLCLEERENKLWLCEVNNHDMDMKIIESKPVLDIVEELQNEGLDHSFWSVRIVFADHGEVCPIPELKQEFPHQYDFFCKMHHGILDGNTITYIFRVFTEILNDVLSGKTVDDTVKIGNYIYNDPLQAKLKEIQEALESDPLRLYKEKKRMLRVTMKQPILYSAYPMPQKNHSTTHHIIRKVDNNKVHALYRCCKLKNINMTAGFEAVFNTALVEMVGDTGVVQNEYQINIRQNINMRRYIEVERDFNKFPMGNFHGSLQQDTYCKEDSRKHFWEHAQDIHNDFYNHLKNNGAIVESIVRPQVKEPVVQGHEDPNVFAKGPPRDCSDYAFSNMLDITPFVLYEGSEVQLTDVISYNFINKFIHPILFQLFTYRGFGKLICSYDTAKIEDDTANELMDRIMNVLDYVTK